MEDIVEDVTAVTVVHIATTMIVGVMLRKNVTPKLASCLNKLIGPSQLLLQVSC